MANLSALVKRYNSTTKSKGFVDYYKIPASEKWAEYSLDEYRIRQLMKTVEFTDKFEAEKALEVVRRKVDYMYKHPNFNVYQASALYKKLKRLVG